MKSTTRTIKIELQFKVPTYTADDGTTFELTDSELKSKLTSEGLNHIHDKVLSKKSYCKLLDRAYKFNSFNYDCSNLIYDETNKEIYEHFIHHYLKEYYVDSRNSRHSTNGGNWGHYDYDVELGIHKNMLNHKFKLTDPTDLSVKDMILIHLMSGDGVRMYGTGMHYRRVKELKTIDEQKKFWKWIFDSKMFNPNDPVVQSVRMKQIFKSKEALSNCNNNYKNWFNQYKTIAHLIINKCWRDGNLEVLKWIVDEYKLDLYEVDKLHLIYPEINFSNSLYYSIINAIHDKRIHDTYNNGILSRLYDYDTKKLLPIEEREKMWENNTFDRLVNFIKFINSKWPLLKLESSTNYVNHPNVITKYNDLEDCLQNSILKDQLKYDTIKGSKESAESLISNILS